MSVQSRGVPNNGYNERQAKYQPFIAFTSRYKSFVSWPHKHVLQSPRNMALAGFFYLGSTDRARCFYCGLTLRDWDEGDDPFKSHRQWSPNCAYISTIADQQLNSGLQSLQLSDNTMTSSPSPFTPRPNNVIASDSVTVSDAQSESSRTSYMVTPRMPTSPGTSMYGAAVSVDCPDEGIGLESTMSGAWRQPPHVEAVLEMGYPMDVIARTIDRWREEGKGEFTNASTLMAAIEGWD